MKCIKSITIKNFRTHKKLKLRLSPKITCITGNSDRGKSNLVRAFRWATLNRPTGTSFIRWGKTQAEVRLSILRHSTCRIRGKKRNIYTLNGEKFEAFGNDVPQPIANLLRMSDINFQLQHEPHFWFSLTPGEVSRQLNKIVSLDVIDKTLANLNTSVAKAKAEVEVCQDRLKEANERRKKLKYAKRMKADLDHLIRLQQKRDRLERKVGEIGTLVESVKICKQRFISSKKTAQQSRKDFNRLEVLFKQYRKADARLAEINQIVDHVKSCEQRVNDSRKRLEKAQRRFEKVSGKRCPLCNQKTKRL